VYLRVCVCERMCTQKGHLHELKFDSRLTPGLKMISAQTYRCV
jgi:hypothetical protein